MIRIQRARENEIKSLVATSIRAFASDNTVGKVDNNPGPPGYDSVSWYMSMLTRADGFYTIYKNETLVGGSLVFCEEENPEKRYILGRIWIDPCFHRQGVGLKALEEIVKQYPDAVCWTLDTPAWNVRTRNFYRKAGFTLVKETEHELYFEKETGIETY